MLSRSGKRSFALIPLARFPFLLSQVSIFFVFPKENLRFLEKRELFLGLAQGAPRAPFEAPKRAPFEALLAPFEVPKVTYT